MINITLFSLASQTLFESSTCTVALTSCVVDMEYPRPVSAVSAPADVQRAEHSLHSTSVPGRGTFVVCEEKDAENTPRDAVDEIHVLVMSREAQPGPSGLAPLDEPGSSQGTNRLDFLVSLLYVFERPSKT